MSQQQEDGQYPRVNSQNLSNHPSGTIISLVGKVISNDGQVACMQTGEEGGNGNVRVMIEPDSFSGKSTHSVLEVVGCLNEDMTITVCDITLNWAVFKLFRAVYRKKCLSRCANVTMLISSVALRLPICFY